MNSKVIKVQSVVSIKTEFELTTATSEVRLNDLNKIESINGTINYNEKYIGSFNVNSNNFNSTGVDAGNLNVNVNVSESAKLTEATILVNKIVEDVGLLYPVKS